MQTFVIGDLHGRADILRVALTAIESREPGTVVFLGDYVDRGPDSKSVIDRLRAGPPEGWTWHILKGNHEDIMVQACRRRSKVEWWIGNGGGRTLISYGQNEGDIANPLMIPENVIKWVASLPLFYEDRHRVYVHAGVDPAKTMPLQTEHDMLWKIYDRRDDSGCGDRHVVHGHHYHVDGPILLRGRSNFDINAWFTGRLVIGVFDDDVPGGPVDTIEIRRPTYNDLMAGAGV